MKITVVGCGKIGCTVINALLTEGHEIVAIDNDPDVISDITNIYDVMTVCGSGTDSDVLLEAGNANLLIAVTGSDEFNMLTCFIAKRLGIKPVSYTHLDVYKRQGFHELEAANA